ncbi:MAG: ATP-binding cassette domain-containing protein [Collinsella intestinalis]
MEWAHIGGYSADEVQAMMGELGLADRAGLHPYDLSGGQRQMLALGKLLLVHPRLLLLDEPTKGLDRAAREHVAGMIEAARRDGVTVIVSITIWRSCVASPTACRLCSTASLPARSPWASSSATTCSTGHDGGDEML